MAKHNLPVITPKQGNFDLTIHAEVEDDGVEMGVLTDGTPFLSLRGLARMCGVDPSAIIKATNEWGIVPTKPRERRIREIVRAQGADDTVIFLAVQKGGSIYHAAPAAVCMAFLEYYAFEARAFDGAKALASYRLLARKGFSDFIYAKVGYNPTGASTIAWQQFHDRVTLTYHAVPVGYFSIFRELADWLVTLIRSGAELDSKFIPDISVGSVWGKRWTEGNLDNVFEERKRYPHNYPSYFPQAASNPQQAFCYPDEALPEFRKWLREEYLPNRMTGCLNDKVKEGKLTAPAATKAIEALTSQRAIAGKKR